MSMRKYAEKTIARHYAFQFLYGIRPEQIPTYREDPSSLNQILMDFEVSWMEEDREHQDNQLSPLIQDFGRLLIQQFLINYETFDAQIIPFLHQGKMQKKHHLDKIIIFIALAEKQLAEQGKYPVPSNVVINEAIELAKAFGTADSPPLVNAVLDRMFAPTQP